MCIGVNSYRDMLINNLQLMLSNNDQCFFLVQEVDFFIQDFLIVSGEYI